MELKKLSELGPALSEYIQNNTTYTVAEVAAGALGIHPVNMSRKLRGKSLKLAELEKIAAFLGMPVTITLGAVEASNTSISETDLLGVQKKLIDCYEAKSKLEEEVKKLKG